MSQYDFKTGCSGVISGSNKFNSEMLFMFAKTSDMLNGNVDLSSFWKTNKYMEINSDIQKGFIPAVFDQNSFNIGDIKNGI